MSKLLNYHLRIWEDYRGSVHQSTDNLKLTQLRLHLGTINFQLATLICIFVNFRIIFPRSVLRHRTLFRRNTLISLLYNILTHCHIQAQDPNALYSNRANNRDIVESIPLAG